MCFGIVYISWSLPVPSLCAQNSSISVDATSEIGGIFDSSTGLQVLIPELSFQCDGLVTSMNVFITRTGDQNVAASPLTLQIWRPSQHGSYVLHWSIEHPGTPFETSREGNIVSFTSQLGVPVIARDVLGIHIQGRRTDKPYFQLAYSAFAVDSTTPTMYYMDGVDGPLCNFSVCGVDVKNRTSILPLISATFGA